MSTYAASDWERDDGAGWVLGMAVISLVAHAAFLAWLASRPTQLVDAHKPLELVMIEVPKPEPPPPPKEEPKEEPKKPPIKVAKPEVPPPPPPPNDAPPPPNDTPPPETPTKPVPLVVGISLSSTTAAGGFAAPVGNTLYGRTADKAVNPNDVKAYQAPKYTPVAYTDSVPEPMGECKGPYPDEAKRAGIEGTVMLKVTVDLEGKVTQAKLVSGLGYGLDEVALKYIYQCKFKPAYKGGEAVSTEITYRYTFLLD